jgi:hypothetical protein
VIRGITAAEYRISCEFFPTVGVSLLTGVSSSYVCHDLDKNKLIETVLNRNPILHMQGVSQIMVHVILPEIITILIMEDMQADEEKAREILVESNEIGMILHEDDVF